MIQPMLEELKKWNKDFLKILLFELLKSEKIDFITLSNLYVEYLKQKQSVIEGKIMPLALHLAQSLNGTIDKENAERLLYECEYFKGSKYGEALELKYKKQTPIK